MSFTHSIAFSVALSKSFMTVSLRPKIGFRIHIHATLVPKPVQLATGRGILRAWSGLWGGRATKHIAHVKGERPEIFRRQIEGAHGGAVQAGAQRQVDVLGRIPANEVGPR